MKPNLFIPKIYDVLCKPAFDFIFPPSCHICHNRIYDNNRYICPSCLSRLPRTRFHRMPMNQMEQRFAGKFPFTAATAHFFYSSDTAIATLIHDLKYRHYRGLAQKMGEIVASELLPTAFFSDIDAIIPIPMYNLKKARRGYNQTEEIAKGISIILSIPIIDNLKAVKSHRTQTRLSIEERLSNLSDIFAVKRPEELKDRHILLLDDVCTTGATITACADTLLTASPTLKITILTLAATT